MVPFVDGELGAATSEKIKQHLAVCASCRHELAQEMQQQQWLRETFAPVPPPPELTAKIREALGLKAETVKPDVESHPQAASLNSIPPGTSPAAGSKAAGSRVAGSGEKEYLGREMAEPLARRLVMSLQRQLIEATQFNLWQKEAGLRGLSPAVAASLVFLLVSLHYLLTDPAGFLQTGWQAYSFLQEWGMRFFLWLAGLPEWPSLASL